MFLVVEPVEQVEHLAIARLAPFHFDFLRVEQLEQKWNYAR